MWQQKNTQKNKTKMNKTMKSVPIKKKQKE
jgi:hypothetical protein